MLTVGNDTNREAYSNLYKESDGDEEFASVTGKFYELSDETTLDQIEHRVYNNSDKHTAKNLVSIINIKDSEGNVVKTYSKELDEIMVSSYIDHTVTWNTAESAAGEYTIEALVYDGSYLVTRSTKTVTVKGIDASYVDISGNVTLPKKILKNTDELVIFKTVKNEFKNRIENAKERIRIANAETNDTVYESEISLNLDGFEKVSSNETVIAIEDFSYAENGEYCIYHEALLEDGRIIAKNIVYKGSVLNVSSYEGDLDFLK